MKYKDPSEKMNDKQFILVDDEGMWFTVCTREEEGKEEREGGGGGREGRRERERVRMLVHVHDVMTFCKLPKLNDVHTKVM